MHNLFFCDEPGCVQIFEDQEEYELHCLRGIHGDQELQQNASEQDKIRNNYASLMKISLQISSIMNVSQGQLHGSKHGYSMCRVPCNRIHEKRKMGATSEKQVLIFRRSEKDIV